MLKVLTFFDDCYEKTYVLVQDLDNLDQTTVLGEVWIDPEEWEALKLQIEQRLPHPGRPHE